MQKSLKFLIGIFAFVALAVCAISFSSAYGYGYGYNDGYSKTYYESSSDSWNGHNYVKRVTERDPWGSHTTYVSDYSYDRWSPYSNRVNDYWSYGWNGNVRTRYYVDYSYDDARQRYNYGTQYHPYYYQSDNYYNGNNWNWRSSSGSGCNNVYACRW